MNTSIQQRFCTHTVGYLGKIRMIPSSQPVLDFVAILLMTEHRLGTTPMPLTEITHESSYHPCRTDISQYPYSDKGNHDHQRKHYSQHPYPRLFCRILVHLS